MGESAHGYMLEQLSLQWHDVTEWITNYLTWSANLRDMTNLCNADTQFDRFAPCKNTIVKDHSVLNEKKTVAIHQPNYLPWIGYFHKISLVDTFVFLDDVQLPQGRSFCSRVKVKGSQGGQWLSVPINKKSGTEITSAKIIHGNWADKHIRTIESLYAKAPFFDRFWPELRSVLRKGHLRLVDLNVDLIETIARLLNWKTKFLRSSLLSIEQSEMQDHIQAILHACDATTYLSGNGSGSQRYIQDAEFHHGGIQLSWQDFSHPEYSQLHGQFEPFMSVIDFLFCTGDGGILREA